jgi:hypothetical protein
MHQHLYNRRALNQSHTDLHMNINSSPFNHIKLRVLHIKLSNPTSQQISNALFGYFNIKKRIFTAKDNNSRNYNAQYERGVKSLFDSISTAVNASDKSFNLSSNPTHNAVASPSWITTCVMRFMVQPIAKSVDVITQQQDSTEVVQLKA